MRKLMRNLTAAIVLLLTVASCKKTSPDDNKPQHKPDQFAIITNITSGDHAIGYVGTFKDFSISDYTNAKARQTTQYPFIKLYKDAIFMLPNMSDDVVKKFNRQPDGTLSDEGSLTMPAGSVPISMVVASDTKAYISLREAGKIAIINPSSMKLISYIDLTSFAIGDGSPDPSTLLLKENKLYVACGQTTDGYTSDRPAQVLIIDLADNNAVTSLTDSRTTYAGNVDEKRSMFTDEQGDIYVLCMASHGFAGPSQKAGFLRIKNGETKFDPDYFFNVTDYKVDGIPGNSVSYIEHMQYAGNGIVYCTGNIPALTSNPPDYVNDHTFGSFKVDLSNKAITKLDLPYSNGYATGVLVYDQKAYFGLSSKTGVGIYRYNPDDNTADKNPLIKTQGDPAYLDVFE